MKLEGLKINILGDSITEGVGASSGDFCYPNVFARESGAVVRNYGISGTRIAGQQVDDGAANNVSGVEFVARCLTMDDDADVIAVMGGTNDYGHGDAPFGNESDKTEDTFCGAVNLMLERLIEKYPTATVVVMTPLHREGENVPNMHGKVLADYVKVIRRACKRYSVPCLDLYAMGGICPDIPAQKKALAPDGLHPNDAGHALIAARLKGYLETL